MRVRNLTRGCCGEGVGEGRGRLCGTCLVRLGCLEPGWSPRQESNLYLALRRHLFYPLNYGERIVLTGWNEALLLLASALSRGRFRLFCFVLSEAP